MLPFRHFLPFAFASLLLATLLSAQEPTKAPPAPRVDVFTVSAPQEENLVFSYPGKIVSSQSVIVKARANGILEKKFFTEGQSVKAGDTLYTIESDSYAAAQALAKANVHLWDVSFQKTRKEWERIKALFESGASSEQEKDVAYFAHESVKASLQVAKASLQTATINLEHTTVKASSNGVVGMKLVDVGTLVSDGTALVEITQVDLLHVEFSIPDSDVMKQKYAIKNGKWSHPTDGKLKASLMVREQPYKELGVVDFLDSSLNTKTGSLRARATFKNPDKALLPNQFVTVNLLGLTRNNVIKVPQKAVLQNPLGTIVFVVVDGKATVRPVKIGESSENDFIIESGLKQGDVVIVNNFFKIKNGAPVTVDKIINPEAK